MTALRVLLFLTCTLSTVQAISQSVYSRQFSVNADKGSTRTGLRLYKNDVVFIKSTGKATYGPMARFTLGPLSAAGSADRRYTNTWNRPPYQRHQFGAVLCRIGSDTASAVSIRPDFRECLTGPFDIGVCSPAANPVTGTLFVVKNAGELMFDINDMLCLDNNGTFIIDVLILSATVAPFDFRYDSISSLLCGLIMGSNPNGSAYNEHQLQQVAQTGNTYLLPDFAALNSYYRFLNEHPTVRVAGVKWQQVAVEVTGLLLLSNRLLDELREPSVTAQMTDVNFMIWMSYILLTSEHGRQFIEGTASKGLVNHITNQFYRPLIRGEFVVTDPFWFDVAAVYAEQYNPDLQGYYREFNKFDKVLIEGSFARYFAKEPGCHYPNSDFLRNRKLSIGKPADRLWIGLYKMGYSEARIQQALSEIAILKSQGLNYTALMNRLKARAVRISTAVR